MEFDFFPKLLIGGFLLAIGISYRHPLLLDPIAAELLSWEQRTAHDLKLARTRNAAQETARYIDEYMSNVRSYQDRYALFRDSVAAAKRDGLYCEFGVFQGESINFIAHGWRNGEFKAFSELVERHGLKFLHLGYADQQVAVIITR